MDLHARNADVVVDTPMPPPRWALLERLLIDAQTASTQEFYDRYFDERGYLECYPRWGGDDGPDDAAENFAHWTELYALGAPKVILDLYRKAWEGHLRQYTEAKTTHVPFARDGMYYREFPVMFDWAHNGEGFVAFWLEGLTDPYQDEFQRRTPALRRHVHERGPHIDEELRPEPQAHPKHVQRQPRPHDAQDDCARLGGRPLRGRGPLHAHARRAQLPGDARPLQGLQRRRGRPPPEPEHHHARAERLHDRRRAEVP